MSSFACPRRLGQRKHGPSVSLLSVSQSNYVRTSAEQSMQGSALNCFLIRSRRSTPSLSSAYHALQLMVRLHLPASVLHLPRRLAATPYPISPSAVLLLSLGPWPLSPRNTDCISQIITSRAKSIDNDGFELVVFADCGSYPNIYIYLYCVNLLCLNEKLYDYRSAGIFGRRKPHGL